MYVCLHLLLESKISFTYQTDCSIYRWQYFLWGASDLLKILICIAPIKVVLPLLPSSLGHVDSY